MLGACAHTAMGFPWCPKVVQSEVTTSLRACRRWRWSRSRWATRRVCCPGWVAVMPWVSGC